MCQNYVWIRILLLWLGCYKAQSGEAKFRHSTITRRIRCAWATFFKIPSYIIVYSSWMPAIGYAFAYLIDCDIVHLYLDNIFASSNGIYTFQFWNFIRAASVQMRNIWLIALFIKCVTLIEVHCWRLHRLHGNYGTGCTVFIARSLDGYLRSRYLLHCACSYSAQQMCVSSRWFLPPQSSSNFQFRSCLKM